MSIDWEAGKDAIRKLGLNRSLWIPKWVAGFAPVGKVQKRNGFQDHGGNAPNVLNSKALNMSFCVQHPMRNDNGTR
jgi:hypothetical protein